MNSKHSKRILAITIAAAVSMTLMNSASAKVAKPRNHSKSSGKNQPITSISRDELNKVVELDVARTADDAKFLSLGCFFGCTHTSTVTYHPPTDLTNLYNHVAILGGRISINSGHIDNNIQNISALTTDFGSLQGQVATNVTDIGQNTNNIAQNTSDINQLDTTTQNLSTSVATNIQNINILGNSVNKIIDNVNYLNQLTQQQGNEIQANATKINYVQGVAQNNALNIVKNANAIAFNALNSTVLAHSIKQNADMLLKNLGIIDEVNNEVELTGEMSQTDFTRLRQAVLENSDALGDRTQAFTQGLVLPDMNEVGLTKANVNIKTLIRRATSSAEFALGQHHALNGILTVLALTNAIHNAFVAHVALWQIKNPPSELLKGLSALMQGESEALQKLQKDPAIKKALMPASSTEKELDVPDIQSGMLEPGTLRSQY
jgi:hypothetical protein